MKSVKIKDKEFVLSIKSDEIEDAVENIAVKVNNDLNGKNPLFITILNGAFMFASDLLKKIEIPCEITFVKLSSYSGIASTQIVKKIIGLNVDITGRDIIIVEDIIDTGITMENMLKDLSEHNPSSIRIATFLFKPKAFTKDYKIDYIGMEIPNDFIVGYGLDYDGYGRNYKDIYKIKE